MNKDFNPLQSNEAELVKWKKRLCSLPDEIQSKISAKYYGGKMPWKNSGLSSDGDSLSDEAFGEEK